MQENVLSPTWFDRPGAVLDPVAGQDLDAAVGSVVPLSAVDMAPKKVVWLIYVKCSMHAAVWCCCQRL